MDKVRSFFKNLLGLENIITIVGIVVAAIHAYSGIKYDDEAQVLNAVITILGSLAFAQIVAGYAAAKTRKSVERIEGFLKKPTVFFTTREELDAVQPFQQFLAQGQDVLIVGTSLLGTVGPLRTFLRTLVRQGASLRFLLLDPDSSYLEFAARTHGVSTESLRNDINATLLHLNQLVSSIGETERGSIQFRLLNTIPNVSCVIRDGDKSDGEIRCELYLYQTDVTERPVLCLTPADGIIYRRLRDSVERLWNDSRSAERSPAR